MTAAADIRLSNGVLSVQVRPARGCDVVSVLDRETDTELLFRSPWSGEVATAAAWDDRSRWLAGYPGGWQVLCPNAGAGRHVDGAFQGFHGEAAMVPWQVRACDETSLTAEVDLFSAPLRLGRTIHLIGPVLQVTDSIHNLGGRDRSVAWVEHIGFGAPLLDSASRLYLPECTVLADPAAPGTLLAADSSHRWPDALSAEGDPLDLSHVPGPDSPREIFAAATRLAAGWCAVVNEARGVGATLTWDVGQWPHAWLWQEVHATQDFPWFGRAYVLGIEPANVLPDHGGSRPPAPVLRAGERRCASVELSVFRPTGAVTHVGAGGRVTSTG